MGGRKGVFRTPAGEGGAGEHPLASDALEVSADLWRPPPGSECRLPRFAAH